MVEYATFEDLSSYSQGVDKQILLREAFSISKKNIFLAHSSKDEKHLPDIIYILKKHGGRVYVDKGDARLPKKPNKGTAEILRKTIQKCHRFILFVTPNSKDSRWIPWELGLADGKKSSMSVVLFPTLEYRDEQDWAETEYLGLYRRIVWVQTKSMKEKRWFVFDHEHNSGTPLEQWIRED